MNVSSHPLRKLAFAAGTIALLATTGLAQANQANDVVALKHALYGAGYDIENVSPALDDTTRAELERFQREQGLQPSGVLDEPTERALGMISVQQAAGATEQPVVGSVPPAGAVELQAAAEAVEEEEEDGGWSLW
ncbi:MAG: peptidoglycan-binding domain-containing protein [Marinobacter sp.]